MTNTVSIPVPQPAPDDKQRITLTLNAHSFSMHVDRDAEPFYRKAQDLLNREYEQYRRRMPSASSEQIWMYVSLHVAVNLFASTREKDLEPYLKAINHINQEIEKKLNNTNN